MKDLRVEITDEGTAFYIAVDPEGSWASSTHPDDLITIDWDQEGRVIGIEAIGSAAQKVIGALFRTLEQYPATDDGSLRDALGSLVGV